MKRLARKTAVVFATLVAAFGIVALPTTAEADTGWGWSAPSK